MNRLVICKNTVLIIERLLTWFTKTLDMFENGNWRVSVF